MTREPLTFPKHGLEISDIRPCAACGRQLLKREGLKSMQAYRITIDSLFLDPSAMRQYAGVALILGGEGPLAAAMAPDTELMKCVGTQTAVVCQPCYFDRSAVDIAEAVRERVEKSEKPA